MAPRSYVLAQLGIGSEVCDTCCKEKGKVYREWLSSVFEDVLGIRSSVMVNEAEVLTP